eukprot:1476712-Amphidinium_carterae.1
MVDASFRSLCEKHARVSASLSKADVRQADMLCEVWKAFLQSRAQAALEDSSSSNVLLQYSLDLTPIRGRRFLPGSALRRGARPAITTHELLVQWLQVSICSAGSEEHHFITRDPLPMEKGKTTLALAAAAQAFLSSTGCFGVTEGVVCFHQVHDRGVAERFKEFLSGHVLGIGGIGGEEASTQGDVRDQYQLHTASGCSLHDLHNSVRWGWQMTFPDSEPMLKQMYVGICAYRVSMTSIHMHLAQWLDTVLVPVEDVHAPAQSELVEFYTCLGARSDLLAQIAEDMRLLWDPVGGRLIVRHGFLAREGALQDLMNVLGELWDYPTFTTSRWLSVGTSCRHFILCVATGFMALFGFMRKRGMSEYDMSAGDQLNTEHVSFSTVIGLLSYPADAATGILLSDSRLVKRKVEIEESVQEEISYLQDMPEHVWRRLSLLGHLHASTLRDMVLRGVFCSMAYFFEHSLKPLEALPWSLCEGDVLANMEALVASETCPSEHASRHLWQLGKAGLTTAALVRVVHMLATCSFTTKTTEKLHASAATVGRFHTHTVDVLCSRAFMHSIRLFNYEEMNCLPLTFKTCRKENWQLFSCSILVAR